MRDFPPLWQLYLFHVITMEINMKMWTLCRALFSGAEGVALGVQGYPEAGEGALRDCARSESRTPEMGSRVAPLRCRWGHTAQLVKGQESALRAPSGAGPTPHSPSLA